MGIGMDWCLLFDRCRHVYIMRSAKYNIYGEHLWRENVVPNLYVMMASVQIDFPGRK